MGRLYLFAVIMQCFIHIPYMIRAAKYKQSAREVMLRLLDLFFQFAAPPGLAIVMLVVGAVACARLVKDGLLLKFPEMLKVGADVSVICFDKTGTLTSSSVGPDVCVLLHYWSHTLFASTKTCTSDLSPRVEMCIS